MVIVRNAWLDLAAFLRVAAGAGFDGVTRKDSGPSNHRTMFTAALQHARAMTETHAALLAWMRAMLQTRQTVAARVGCVSRVKQRLSLWDEAYTHHVLFCVQSVVGPGAFPFGNACVRT